MTEYKINLLERIYAGHRTFSTLGRKLSDYEEFIPQAKALLELEANGFIVIRDQQQETIEGRRLYYEFQVERLTRSGLEAIGKDLRDD